MYQALTMMAEAISSCAGWFLRILVATSGQGVWLSGVFLFLTYKFLFAPLFGEAKSDLAKHSYNAFKRRKEK